MILRTLPLDGDGFREIITHHHVHNPSRELLMVWDYQGNLLWEYLSSPTEEQNANAPPGTRICARLRL